MLNVTKKKRTKSNLKIHNWGKLSLELIVVFLGVTAGFLLNNWRMNVHDKQLEKSYLAGLVDDATQNQINIQSSITLDSLWLSRATPLLGVFAQGNFPTDSAKSAIELIIIFHRFEASTNTYQNIINSGNMNIIKNFDFKRQIVDYQDAITGLNALDEIYYTFYKDYSIPLVIKEFNLASGTLIGKSISNPAMLSNIFSLQYWMVLERNKHYKNLLDKSNELKNSLQKS